MATRVLQILSDFVRWRWAPFVGLLGASLFYVLFAILLIPSQVGASETEEEETPGIEAPEPGSERGDEGTESDTHTSAPSPVKHIDRSSPAQAPPAPKRRGFSPPLERPEPAPPTPPPPPPAVAEQVPAPPQAPPPPDPAAAAAAEEQQRLGAAAAARAATLAATRASRLSGRGLRPRLAAEVPPAAEAPVHEESEVAADNEEESDAPESNANAEQGDAAGDDESDDSDGEEAAEAEPQEAEDE